MPVSADVAQFNHMVNGQGRREHWPLCQRECDHWLERQEAGYCVTSTGLDQNEGTFKVSEMFGRITDDEKADCIEMCLSYDNATGCEVIWDQDDNGCYVHTSQVSRGNGADNHACWVFDPDAELFGYETFGPGKEPCSGLGLSLSPELVRHQDLDECRNLCNLHSDCNGFMYDVVLSKCYLKEHSCDLDACPIEVFEPEPYLTDIERESEIAELSWYFSGCGISQDSAVDDTATISKSG